MNSCEGEGLRAWEEILCAVLSPAEITFNENWGSIYQGALDPVKGWGTIPVSGYFQV